MPYHPALPLPDSSAISGGFWRIVVGPSTSTHSWHQECAVDYNQQRHFSSGITKRKQVCFHGFKLHYKHVVSVLYFFKINLGTTTRASKSPLPNLRIECFLSVVEGADSHPNDHWALLRRPQHRKAAKLIWLRKTVFLRFCSVFCFQSVEFSEAREFFSSQK